MKQPKKYSGPRSEAFRLFLIKQNSFDFSLTKSFGSYLRHAGCKILTWQVPGFNEDDEPSGKEEVAIYPPVGHAQVIATNQFLSFTDSPIRVFLELIGDAGIDNEPLQAFTIMCAPKERRGFARSHWWGVTHLASDTKTGPLSFCENHLISNLVQLVNHDGWLTSQQQIEAQKLALKTKGLYELSRKAI